MSERWGQTETQSKLNFRWIMETARFVLADSLIQLGSRLDGRPAILAALKTLAADADNKSLSQDIRDECRLALQDTIARVFHEDYGPPVLNREEIISAFKIAVQHDSGYQGSYTDLMHMLDSFDDGGARASRQTLSHHDSL